MILEIINLKYINVLLTGILITLKKRKRQQHNTFRCANCGSECDIEDRVIDNCCLICVSGLGYPKDVYWSDTDKLIVGARK